MIAQRLPGVQHWESSDEKTSRRSHRYLGFGLILLGVALIANSLLGPLASEMIEYHFSETLINQGIGLDAVSLIVAAPLSIIAGVLALRGHSAAPALALGPAVYSLYMAVQYPIGPEYLSLPGNNERFFLFHVGLFIVGGAVELRAWTLIDHEPLPTLSRRTTLVFSAVLIALGALLFVRYLPGLIDITGGEPTLDEYLENPTSFFLIA
ncbi:MAG: hypothetical protein L0177_07275, partial [Chloroflexi bacterium]|nr:hypothetical protein [Chloroflexota bacterium]